METGASKSHPENKTPGNCYLNNLSAFGYALVSGFGLGSIYATW
jgi:hypothetical protein